MIFNNTAEDFADDVLDDGNELDNSGEIRYSKKGYAKKQFKFQYENFPPDNETHNTAHQDALHWARLDSVEVSDQRLIYSNNYWYVVEKFSDFLNNYQVVERISNTTFDKIYKEIKENGRSGRIKSISTSTDFIDKLNQPSYSLKTRKSSVDSVEIRHGKEDNQVQRLDKNQVERGERTGSNGARDSSQSRSNKQGIKFSLKDSDGNALSPEQQEYFKNRAPTKNPDIRFSKKSFSEQVDDVLCGKDTNNTHLQVRESTPKIFLDLGLDNKPMLITSVHTRTAVNQKVANKNIHFLSVTTLKELPKLLESPAIVFESTKKDSIVAFVNTVDNNNNPIMCAININGKGNYNNLEIDTNLISSVYGKDSNPIGFIEKAVDEDRILYWNKKISQDLFKTPGLQLPDNLNKLDSNIIIRKSKWIVNTNSEKFSNKIKFSTKDNATYTLSDGQVKKKVANFTKLKVYSKVEAESIINSILETNFKIATDEAKAKALLKVQ